MVGLVQEESIILGIRSSIVGQGVAGRSEINNIGGSDGRDSESNRSVVGLVVRNSVV